MSKLGVMRVEDPTNIITGARFQDWMTAKRIYNPKPVRLNRESLGTPIRQWEVDDHIRNPNPLN